MKNLKTVALATILASVISVPVQADTYSLYGEVEGWRVFVDETKKTCLIERTDENENVVQMGLTDDNYVYLGVFTKDEVDFENGEAEAIQIIIGDQSYSGNANTLRGNLSNDYSGGYVYSTSPQFAEDLAKQYTAQVFPEKSFAFTIDLTGTLNAMKAAQECNEKQSGS
jgi:hypothetical protein